MSAFCAVNILRKISYCTICILCNVDNAFRWQEKRGVFILEGVYYSVTYSENNINNIFMEE